MKAASEPAPVNANLRSRQTPVEPALPAIDLTRGDTPSYSGQKEQRDYSKRRADPQYQDGRYGFDSTEDQMEVDTEAPVSVNRREEHRDHRRDDRRDARQDDRGDGRVNDRNYTPGDFGRGRFYQGDRDSGRPRNDRRLYSDNLYPRSRGRGFR